MKNVKLVIVILLIVIIFLFLDDLNKKKVDFKLEIPISYNRDDFGLMLESLKFKSMIEIGVQTGGFANRVLSKWPSFQNYYGIDPWEQQKNYVDTSNVQNDQQEVKYKQTMDLLKKYGEKIKLIRNYSTNAVSLFKDKTIDFIYVDARHDYCGCYEDLTLFYPKLKCNGIMAGHDYQTAQETLDYTSNIDDWGICGNGTRILKNGGAVKGNKTKKITFLVKFFVLNQNIKKISNEILNIYFIYLLNDKGAVLQFTKEKGLQILVTREHFYVSYLFKKKC